MSAQGTYRFYSVQRQTILLVKGEPLGRKRVKHVEKQVKPGFQMVVPVARIVSVASNFWKRQGRSYGNDLAITQDNPCDRNDQSSEIDSSSILATETTGKDSQAIAHF